jgi:hypothetical protein
MPLTTSPTRAPGAHRAGPGGPEPPAASNGQSRPAAWPTRRRPAGALGDAWDTAEYLRYKVLILAQAGQLRHIEPGVLRLAADRVDPADKRVIAATLPAEHPARLLVIESALLLARSRPRTGWLPRTETADLGHPIPWTVPAETRQATSGPGSGYHWWKLRPAPAPPAGGPPPGCPSPDACPGGPGCPGPGPGSCCPDPPPVTRHGRHRPPANPPPPGET